MSEQIIQVLDYLCEKFGVAIDWTSQNLKPQIETLGKHIINYNIANSIFLLVIGLILTVCYLWRTYANYWHCYVSLLRS